MLHVPPADNPVPQVLVWVNGAPGVLIPLIVSGEPPEYRSVITCGVEVPVGWLPKARLVELRPSPRKAAVCDPVA
jgi:hypothetical protein